MPTTPDISSKSSLDLQSAAKSEGSSAGGYHSSPLVNIAFPGATLSATSTADGTLGKPASWLWWIGGALALLLFIKVWRGKGQAT